MKPISRRAAAAVAATMTLTLSACSMNLHGAPEAGPPDRVASSAMPSSVSGAQQVMDVFDQRFNDVLDRVRGPQYDGDQWERVNTMGRLRTGRFWTWVEQAAGVQHPAPTWRHTVTSVVGRAQDGARDSWVLIGAVSAYQPPGGDAAGRVSQQPALWVMVRDEDHPLWRMADLVFLKDDRLQWPRENSASGAAPAPTATSSSNARPSGSSAAADTATVNEALSAVITALETGDASGLRGSGQLRDLKHDLRVGEGVEDRYSCYPRSAKPGAITVAEHSPDRVVLADRPIPLVVLRLHCDIDHTATGGAQITVPAYKATVDRLPRRSDHTQNAYSVSVVVGLKDVPMVAGVGADEVLRKGVTPPQG